MLLSNGISGTGTFPGCRYGPFWIATTLVFVTAVTGNYASYVSHNRHEATTGSETQAWYYDIDKASCCHHSLLSSMGHADLQSPVMRPNRPAPFTASTF